MSDRIEKYQWSMGNGQCPACHGCAPNRGWWTDKIGHKKNCSIAGVMKKAGLEPVYEHENPERCVGMYDPQKGKPGNHFLAMIRANDPDKEKKIAQRFKP